MARRARRAGTEQLELALWVTPEPAADAQVDAARRAPLRPAPSSTSYYQPALDLRGAGEADGYRDEPVQAAGPGGLKPTKRNPYGIRIGETITVATGEHDGVQWADHVTHHATGDIHSHQVTYKGITRSTSARGREPEESAAEWKAYVDQQHAAAAEEKKQAEARKKVENEAAIRRLRAQRDADDAERAREFGAPKTETMDYGGFDQIETSFNGHTLTLRHTTTGETRTAYIPAHSSDVDTIAVRQRNESRPLIRNAAMERAQTAEKRGDLPEARQHYRKAEAHSGPGDAHEPRNAVKRITSTIGEAERRAGAEKLKSAGDAGTPGEFTVKHDGNRWVVTGRNASGKPVVYRYLDTPKDNYIKPGVDLGEEKARKMAERLSADYARETKPKRAIKPKPNAASEGAQVGQRKVKGRGPAGGEWDTGSTVTFKDSESNEHAGQVWSPTNRNGELFIVTEDRHVFRVEKKTRTGQEEPTTPTKVGDEVALRSRDLVNGTGHGRVVEVSPAGDRIVETDRGHRYRVNPKTGEARREQGDAERAAAEQDKTDTNRPLKPGENARAYLRSIGQIDHLGRARDLEEAWRTSRSPQDRRDVADEFARIHPRLGEHYRSEDEQIRKGLEATAALREAQKTPAQRLQERYDTALREADAETLSQLASEAEKVNFRLAARIRQDAARIQGGPSHEVRTEAPGEHQVERAGEQGIEAATAQARSARTTVEQYAATRATAAVEDEERRLREEREQHERGGQALNGIGADRLASVPPRTAEINHEIELGD